MTTNCGCAEGSVSSAERKETGRSIPFERAKTAEREAHRLLDAKLGSDGRLLQETQLYLFERGFGIGAYASGQSVYVGFAGMGDRRRVWHFDGASWTDRSGSTGPLGLLDVECNAIAVDPSAPQNIYVGMDIGVWSSTDSGQTWNPLENGLPEAPVYDLQIRPTQRLLRASLYGRGV